MSVFKLFGKSFSSLAEFGVQALLPAQRATKIVKSDTENLPGGAARAIWSATEGTLNLVFPDGSETTAFPVFPGMNQISVLRVKTGGTAADVWALY